MKTVIEPAFEHKTLHDKLVFMQYQLQEKEWKSIERFEFLPANAIKEWYNVTYHEDGEGEYAIVHCDICPTDVYVEIDNGTYGNMNGFRMFREDLELRS